MFFWRALIAAALVLGAVASSAPRVLGLPWPPSGVVVVGDTSAEQLGALGPVWYYDYGFSTEGKAGHQRVYLVPLRYDEAQMVRTARKVPGTWWMVGNEPNDPNQDNLSPNTYAAVYRRVESALAEAGAEVHLMPGGLANADWEWADAFRESYRAQFGDYPEVDAWNIHNYVLEPDRDQLDVGEFQHRIIGFRAWMAAIGEGHKPLFLTELGALYGTGRHGRPPEDPKRIVAYIGQVVPWLARTDHVQCWSWFATDTNGQFNGDLYFDGELSIYGRAYSEASADAIAYAYGDREAAK